ncbi:hypothetical protein BDP27DRAFT_1370638 [Rhodocollybia butyracea]|uniref:Cytochrome b561 domain-containing protein n=1 Tax=Rhodocollybia butyracea TaxID=206335 RepID=A0A9P5TZF7_9AGAR|nr:hypothetical protein BDP27DRAFT_1370638 [Rhodocollybia butyracea]
MAPRLSCLLLSCWLPFHPSLLLPKYNIMNCYPLDKLNRTALTQLWGTHIVPRLYTLSGTGKMVPGWMGVGFGSQMADSPMVILWSNSDGSITVSQREAPKKVNGSNSEFVFSIPSESTTIVPTIWAFGPNNPSSSSSSANIRIHEEVGTATFNLSQTFTGVASASTSFIGFQIMALAHAVMLIFGFLVLLPLGALLARYLRTFNPVWFKCHWIIQVAISGPIIFTGVLLGVFAVTKSGGPHLGDGHKQWGVAISVLYLFQCSLGYFIHRVKFNIVILGRPPQNYYHAFLGIFIIAAAFYQVRTGYKVEWLLLGRGPLGSYLDIIWYIWIVILAMLYSIGLIYLPKQFKQEKENRRGNDHSTMFMLDPASRSTRSDTAVSGQEQGYEIGELESEEHHTIEVEPAKFENFTD